MVRKFTSPGKSLLLQLNLARSTIKINLATICTGVDSNDHVIYELELEYQKISPVII